jgi:hypothetical protein
MNQFDNELDLLNQLSQLIKETCNHPKDSLERKQGLTKIIFLMQQSGKIWRGGKELNLEHYQEALQENWYFFRCNLCQQDSTANKPYNSQRANVITWFNTYLEYRLRDIQQQAAQEMRRRAFFNRDLETGRFIDPIEMIPAPAETSSFMMEDFTEWLEENKHKLSRINLRDRAEINSYILISHRLILEQSWKVISHKFNVPIPTLSKFYNHRCLPIIQDWGKSQGYLND